MLKDRKIHTIAKMNQKKARVAILISNNVDFRTRNTIKDKKRHVKMIKVSFHQEDVIILDIYMPNNKASKYTKAKLRELKQRIDKSIFVVVHFDPCSVGRTCRQKITKDTGKFEQYHEQ